MKPMVPFLGPGGLNVWELLGHPDARRAASKIAELPSQMGLVRVAGICSQISQHRGAPRHDTGLEPAPGAVKADYPGRGLGREAHLGQQAAPKVPGAPAYLAGDGRYWHSAAGGDKQPPSLADLRRQGHLAVDSCGQPPFKDGEALGPRPSGHQLVAHGIDRRAEHVVGVNIGRAQGRCRHPQKGSGAKRGESQLDAGLRAVVDDRHRSGVQATGQGSEAAEGSAG
jgi:hypothetical protein